MAENATKFSAEELCREIIPATLKPRARVENVKREREDLRTKAKVIELPITESYGIEIEIKVEGAKRRAYVYKDDSGKRPDKSEGNGNSGAI